MKNKSRLILLIAMVIMTSCATSRYYKLPKMEFSDVDYKYETKYIKVRNINVAYIDEGSGENTLIMIHGLGSNAKAWIKNIEGLKDKFRIIALDLPGYGKSDKEYYQYSLKFYSRVLKEMMALLKIKTAIYTGHSMGGQIAIITALKYPEIVKGLVLISPAGFEKFEDGEGHWLRNAVTPEFVHDTPIRNIDINLKSNFYNTPTDAEFMITERIQIRGASDFDKYCYAVSKNVGAMIDDAVWDKLEQISQPTLILFGENDALIPNPYLHGGKTADIAKIGGERIPQNKLVVIPECGHFVQFEKAETTNREISEYFGK